VCRNIIDDKQNLERNVVFSVVYFSAAGTKQFLNQS